MQFLVGSIMMILSFSADKMVQNVSVIVLVTLHPEVLTRGAHLSPQNISMCSLQHSQPSSFYLQLKVHLIVV